MATNKHTDVNLLARLLRQARPYWIHILCLFLLSLLSTPIVLLGPLPLKIAVDSVLGSEPIPGFLDNLLPAFVTVSKSAILIFALGLLVMVALLEQLKVLAEWVLYTYTGEKMVLDFRAMLFHHVQRLSLSYHDSVGTADSTYRIQYDAPAIQHVAIHGVIPFLTSGVTLAAMVYVTARIDLHLAAVALAISPVAFVVFLTWRRRLRSQWSEVAKLESSAMSVLQEVLAAVRVVKAFGKEDQEKERFSLRSEEGIRAKIIASLSEGIFGLILGLVTAAGTVAVLYIGIRHVRSGSITLGELLLVMTYLAQIYGPVKTISRSVASLQSDLARADRAFSVLDEAQDVPDYPNARPLARALGGVTFRNVSFAYKDSLVLRNISFDIDPGTRLGITGVTGAGKTTLVNLLTRFYDLTDGKILLDGVDLREYKLRDLRNQYAIVLQEPILFSTTIAENIAYARPSASMEEIVEAAKAANAHDFIINLPDDYATLVGERGMRLSGGERQSISLARAFLKNAPILILDEPTSSVDLKTEAAIIEAMNQLMKGRTTFLISHRPSTLAICNAWIVIKDGILIDKKASTEATRGTS